MQQIHERPSKGAGSTQIQARSYHARQSGNLAIKVRTLSWGQQPIHTVMCELCLLPKMRDTGLLTCMYHIR